MRWLSSALVFLSTILVGQASAEEFAGWQGLRVIQQEGRPRLCRAADLDGDGRQELIVVNNRSSRLDVYAWLDKALREKPVSPNKSQPNDLPMAPELMHTEVQLEHLPRDFAVQDLDGDDQPELVILVSPPNQVLIYERTEAGLWSERSKFDLLEGGISSRRPALLLRELGEGEFQLLVSLSNGIQQLLLQPGGRAEWLSPREEQSRNNWWLADLDGDGNEDLIEQTRESTDPIRWYRGSAGGMLAPAAVLFDRAVNDAEVIRTPGATEIALLDGSVRQLVRRYRLDVGPPSPFGRRRPLAMDDAPKMAWCGMWQGESPALVAADRNRPRLLSYVLGEAGWEAQRAFPAVSAVQQVASPAAAPDTLLIWAKDASDLLISKWESERLTYPQPMKQSPEVEQRKILALATVGSTTWWVQKVAKHLDLYRWIPGAARAERLRFEDAGAKADEVLWIGGDRLLVKDLHARGLKLAVYEEGKTTVSAPTHLKKGDLGQYKLLAVGDQLRLGRLVEGVLQWIGEDLQSQEQVMLPHGLELTDYIATDSTSGWALQQDSRFVHRIKIEPSGLSHAVEKWKVAPGTALVDDPVLGVLLVNHDRLTHLGEGRPHELKLIEAIDDRVARSGGVRETKFHRLGAADLDGDGYDELLLFDDLEHRITALADRDGTLQPKISWPVFDDKVYPYGDDYESLVQEPRAVVAFDMDGDGRQDLALLTHDRLLTYLARKEDEDE